MRTGFFLNGICVFFTVYKLWSHVLLCAGGEVTWKNSIFQFHGKELRYEVIFFFFSVCLFVVFLEKEIRRAESHRRALMCLVGTQDSLIFYVAHLCFYFFICSVQTYFCEEKKKRRRRF